MEIRVTTHSGEDVTLTVDSGFNATEFATKLNDETLNAIELGGVVFSRIDVKMIMPKGNTTV